MKDFWNKRYSELNYAYGKEPNQFYKSEINSLKGDKILFPAEGEGRNAVYASKEGWDCYAFDISEEGKQKADLLASENNVSLKYIVSDFRDVNYPDEYFDCIVLIFAHVPTDLREDFHQKMLRMLKKGGHILLEGFSKDQINNTTGGPKNEAMLFSKEMLQKDFSLLSNLNINEKDVDLHEGPFHKGLASVIQLIGTK